MGRLPARYPSDNPSFTDISGRDADISRCRRNSRSVTFLPILRWNRIFSSSNVRTSCSVKPLNSLFFVPLTLPIFHQDSNQVLTLVRILRKRVLPGADFYPLFSRILRAFWFVLRWRGCSGWCGFESCSRLRLI